MKDRQRMEKRANSFGHYYYYLWFTESCALPGNRSLVPEQLQKGVNYPKEQMFIKILTHSNLLNYKVEALCQKKGIQRTKIQQDNNLCTLWTTCFTKNAGIVEDFWVRKVYICNKIIGLSYIARQLQQVELTKLMWYI